MTAPTLADRSHVNDSAHPTWEQLHRAAEWNYDLGREHGYLAGLRDASRAMDDALARALAGPHSCGLELTVTPSAKEIVDRLARAMQRGVRT